MFIGSNEDMRAIMKGNLVLNPVADESEVKVLLSKIPENYFAKVEGNVLENGGLVNMLELLVKQTSMYPLVYEDGKYIKPNRRFRKMGDMAVVILYPDIFIQRFQDAVGMLFANQYYGMYASARYCEKSVEPDKFNSFNRNREDRWKKELILAIRLNPNLRVKNINMKKMVETISLSIGNLSDVAVICPIEDLLKGRFPERLLDIEYKGYLDSFRIPKKEVKQWILNVDANVMSIIPTTNWIDKLSEIFPKDKWKPVAQVEKLFPDGDGMPRLAFFENFGRDRVFIHINRIEFQFYEYNENHKTLVNKLLHFIEMECKTGFCHMMLETHADLGVIRDKQILSQTSFREERTCQR